MRRIVNVTHVSLDGVMERMQDWHFDYTDDEMEAFSWDTLAPCDTLVLGRHTYEVFAAVWPTRTGRLADRLNEMTKHVVSSTLTEPDWNNTTVLPGDDLPGELARLKQAPGGDIMTYGYGPVADTMVRHGLLDELHIGINPVLAGKGDLSDMLIREGTIAKLRLTSSYALASGVVMLSYRPTV